MNIQKKRKGRKMSEKTAKIVRFLIELGIVMTIGWLINSGNEVRDFGIEFIICVPIFLIIEGVIKKYKKKTKNE